MQSFAVSKHTDKSAGKKSSAPGAHLSPFAGNQRRQIREALSHNTGEESTEVLQRQEAVQRQPEEEEEMLQPKLAGAELLQAKSPEVMQRQPMEEEEEMLQPKLAGGELLQAKSPEVMQRQPMEEEEEMLQPKFSEGDGSRVQQYREEESGGSGSGSAMPESLQAGLEALSDMDLSGTRVHTNSAKPAQVNALAYTQGQDIYVAPGQEQHLPHEGWHVVQQLQGRVEPSREVNGQSINDDVALEREADVMGEKAANMSLPPTKTSLQPKGKGPVAQHKCEECAKEDEQGGVSIQTKTAANISTGDPRFKIDGFTSTRGVSLPTSIQRQSSDEIGEQDPQKKAEYDALTPEESGGASETAAVPASGTGNEQEAVQLKASDVMQRVTCTPANTALGTGALASANITRESWRSHVTYRARVDNQHDHLKIRMMVFAKVYYGLWVSWETIRFNATVDLTCQSVENKCEIAANERGGSVWDLSHSPAAGAIAVQTNSRAGGTQMGLTVRVGGSVGASSSVSAGVGSASAGVSFPDASISHKMSMGTFIYTCRSS